MGKSNCIICREDYTTEWAKNNHQKNCIENKKAYDKWGIANKGKWGFK